MLIRTRLYYRWVRFGVAVGRWRRLQLVVSCSSSSVKMSWCLLLVMLGSAWAVTDDARLKQAGISQFWTDDYKVFDQIYGRTSDKHLYGARLPSEESYGGSRADADAAGTQHRVHGLGDHFATNYLKHTSEPAKIPNTFIYNAFKPISEESDPDTYDYLKHLEHLAERSPSPLRPGADLAHTDFSSIRDILDAHEASQHADLHLPKYFNPSQSTRGNTPKGRQNPRNSISSSRCGGKGQARCTKRPGHKPPRAHPVRPRPGPRPVIRKIKTIITE